MQNPVILVLGGYGNFGKRICTTLAKEPHWQILIAGKDLHKTTTLSQQIRQQHPQAHIAPYALDWRSPQFLSHLQASQAILVIHCAGPFQGQDYTVAKGCIELGIHYLDLADGRNFVNQIKTLDQQARQKGSVVISGASSVPGLSSAVVNAFAPRFKELKIIHFGIASGNQTERGQATIAAILGYVGKPFQRLEKGQWRTVYGWQDLHRYDYGKILGSRWHANCDIPDLTLFPQHFPTLQTVAFYAGLEVTFLHLTMWLMSWLTRAKIIKNWAPFTRPIVTASHLFDRCGTDKGGMCIEMQGIDHNGKALTLKWVLNALEGCGPYIPTLPSLILVRKILQGEIAPGAQPCYTLFSLEDFDEAAQPWPIAHFLEEIKE